MHRSARACFYDAEASSEPGSPDEQKQSCPNADGPDDSCDALPGRCETFDRYGCRHDGHRAKIHDADDEEDRHRTCAALAAVKSEVQAVSPGGA